METKELQLSISIPFSYTNKKDELSGITLIRRPERTLVYHYVLALCREIESLAGDLDEVSLCAIRFIGGNIHFLWKDDLEKIMTTLSRVFRFSDNIEIVSYAEPGQMTSGPCSVLQDYHFSQILSIPTYDHNESRIAGIAFKALNSLDFYTGKNIPIFGLRTSLGLVERTREQWDLELQGIRELKPEVIEFTLPSVPQNASLMRSFLENLLDIGYSEVSSNIYSLGRKPVFQYSRTGEYLGAGLDNFTRFDGYLTHTTSNIQQYIDNSPQFEKILQSAEQYDT